MDPAIADAGVSYGAGPDLSRIHHEALSNRSEIRQLLVEAHRATTVFVGGLGRDLDREEACIQSVGRSSVSFATKNFDLASRESVALTFEHSGSLFLLTARLLESSGDAIRVALPDSLFIVERRERERQKSGTNRSVPTIATLRSSTGLSTTGSVEDYSVDGVLLRLPDDVGSKLPERLELTFADGDDSGIRQTAYPTNRRSSHSGWCLVGMRITAAPPGRALVVERRQEILGGGRARGRWRRIKLASRGARLSAKRTLERAGWTRSSGPDLQVVRFRNSHGEEIVGLQDSYDFRPGAPVVLIPPAWAKTKETLLPLARTIVSTFRRAGQPIAVLRLDGIRRRGESYRDPEYRSAGSECLGMTFSQGADDIRSAIRFVSSDPAFLSRTVVLVTFSGASIEARKVLAEPEFAEVAGWVSVVGAADLHSGLRVLSGGQDFIGGHERGVRFGRQRVLGIDTNADLVCEDALRNGLAHLEDARRQMAKIRTPITWLQGRDDAWIDPMKVKQILSCGDSSTRRIIEVPTGHQLRSSQEALEVFQLIASEVGRFAIGRALSPEIPDLAELDSRRKAERSRIPNSSVDLEDFWHDYVLGENELPGMELLTDTAAYREMMDAQVRELHLSGDERIADLGSGTGTLSMTLAKRFAEFTQLQVHEFDFIHDALRHSRSRSAERAATPRTRYVRSDLSFSNASRIPAQDHTYDAVTMSLLINYVSDPIALLKDARRIVRSGGRLALAALRPDTDISRIYVNSADEVRRRKAAGEFSQLSASEIESALASCLNEAARLVDLEEQGVFRFWEPDDLARMVHDAGFRRILVHPTFGRPPQAFVISGVAESD